MPTLFSFVAITSTGRILADSTVESDSYPAARRAFWDGLTDEQRNACESFECVDERESPTPQQIAGMDSTMAPL